MLAYTIGRTQSYLRSLAEDPTTQKVGRGPDYEGGWVWRTLEEAQAFIEQVPIVIDGRVQDSTTFSVFGLILPTGWDADVSAEPSAEDGVHRLLHDSRIIAITPSQQT